MLKAIIIDDEERARNALQALLTAYCPEVQLVALSSNVPDGVLAINKHKPDLVFLDIEMPDYNGFELLGFFRDVDFEIIFVTAYSEYAVKAFEVSAIDYLLKPVEADLLKAAVKKAADKRKTLNMQQRLDLLRDNFSGENMRRIALPMSDGLLFIEISDIVMLEADGAYTHVSLRDGSTILVSKKLKFFEDILERRPMFFRPHRSHIVNINFIRKYIRGENLLLMDNKAQITISRDRKTEFEQQLKEQNVTLGA